MKLLFVFILFPFLLFAQTDTTKGIHFEQGLSWEQIKRKAKAENKFIFIDCFATWCAPCKKMDKETYPVSKVGEIVNGKFIAVKVQMDSTREDNEFIKQWYPTVKNLNKNYNIAGYPTYLFFSQEGKLIHQEDGYRNVEDFISIVNDVVDPANQFSKILTRYKNGERDTVFLLKAAKAAKKMGSKELADSIAIAYKSSYLDNLSDADLFTQANIKFVAQDFSYLIYKDGSKGRFFNFFYHYPNRVDSLFEKGFAEYYVSNIIVEEEVKPNLFRDKKAIIDEPNWKGLIKDIADKYNNDYAQQVIVSYKPVYYQITGNWKKWADLFEEKVKNNSPKPDSKNLGTFGDDHWILNDNAWTVFQNCNDKKVLSRALNWSELAIKLKKQKGENIDGYLDTKANILYKLGKVKKAIKTEEKALRLNTKATRKEGKEKGSDFDEFTVNIQKMKAGQPTWKIK